MRAPRLRDVAVYGVIDGYATLSAEEAFGERAGDALALHRHAFTDAGDLWFPITAFLVRTPDRVILVDAGAGPRDSWVVSGSLLCSLETLGVEPGDVSDLVLTHLHWDHIGWVSQKGKVTFQNADIHVHADDWTHFYGSHPGATKRLGPAVDRVRLWTEDHALTPGIDLLHAPGHTPGSAVVMISDGNQRLALLGDVAHCPFQLVDTALGFSSDVDPEAARETRERFARETARQDTNAVGAHFPGEAVRWPLEQEATCNR